MTDVPEKIIDVNADCLLPSDNLLEIPSLRLDVQPSSVGIPFLCFGEQKRSKDMHGRGVLHFYTDDYRWSAVYEHPERILRHNPGAVVEPNYSLFNDTPVAFGLQSIYRKRWIGRRMQDHGIPVFVDLNVANKYYALNLFGIPKGYGAFCTRGYADRLPALEYEYMIAERIADGNRLTFVVYGGGEPAKQWCREKGCVYVTPVIAIKNRLKAIERMKANVAVIDSSTLAAELPLKDFPSLKGLMAAQVENYGTVTSEKLIEDRHERENCES